MATVCTYMSRFSIQHCYVLPTHSVFMCFVCIWKQTAIISLYSINWLVRRRFNKTAKSDYYLRCFCLSLSLCLSVRPSAILSVRMEQIGSDSTNFYNIYFWIIFRKYVANIYVSLKYDMNIGYSTRKQMYFYYSF
jgi:hypothetical protein